MRFFSAVLALLVAVALFAAPAHSANKTLSGDRLDLLRIAIGKAIGSSKPPVLSDLVSAERTVYGNAPMACGLVKIGKTKVPFYGTFEARKTSWVVSIPKKDTSVFAVMATCAKAKLIVPGWQAISAPRSPRATGGGNYKLSPEQMKMIQRDVDKEYRGISSITAVQAHFGGKKTIQVCGYAKKGAKNLPFTGYLPATSSKKDMPFFANAMPRTDTENWALLGLCKKVGLTFKEG